jgi:hypothetical protein
MKLLKRSRWTDSDYCLCNGLLGSLAFDAEIAALFRRRWVNELPTRPLTDAPYGRALVTGEEEGLVLFRDRDGSALLPAVRRMTADEETAR